MAALRTVSVCVVLALALGVTFGCVSGPPPGEEPIQIEKEIKVQRPPATALPQEDTTKDYVALLQKGYAYIGKIYYRNFKFGATENAVRNAAQAEAQKYGADMVWLASGKLYRTERTAAYSRTFYNETNTTTWSSSGGYKDYPYLYSMVTLFALDKDLASRQMRDLEQRRTAYRNSVETLRNKVRTVDELWKSYESNHPGMDEARSAYFVSVYAHSLSEEPDMAKIIESMGWAMDSLSKFWVVDSSTNSITGVTKDCGDRKKFLLALLDASNYLDANKDALTFRPNVPK